MLLACSGLDHARRGFESFARECFTALRDEPDLEIELVKGSGSQGWRERSVRTLTRESRLIRWLARAWGREPFRVEQVAFGLSLRAELRRRKPDVVYFSEWHTGLVLARLRQITGQCFALVLSNGGMAIENFEHLDRVQQLTPAALAAVLERGADPDRHQLLPYAFRIEPHLDLVQAADREALRGRLGLPLGRRVLVSVAALNTHHKRLDYLIEEVARLPEPRPFVLLVGQPEEETPRIRALAGERLGEDGYSVRTVRQTEVSTLLKASDVFVLASLGEAFGRAYVEASAQGLLCLAHDYSVARYALGEHGRFADFSKSEALTGLLEATADMPFDPAQTQARHRFAYESFSWDRLRPCYVDFLAGAVRESAADTAAR